MKKLLLGAILLFSTLSFGQSETVTINTTKMVSNCEGCSVNMEAPILNIDYEITITDKLLTLKMTNQKQIKNTQKYSSVDLSKPQTLVDLELQGVKFISKTNDVYKYQGKSVRIILINTNDIKSLQLEMIDDFTGQISKLTYF